MTHEPESSANISASRQPQTTGRNATHLIEKGWTVYDAAERAVGNVTDIDTARNMLQIDGRPVGFEPFEVPFRLIGGSGDGEVHLTQVVDVQTSSGSGVPRFVTAPTAAVASAPASESAPRRMSGSPAGASARTTQSTTGTAPTPITAASPAASSRPASTYTPPTVPVADTKAATNDWIQHDWEQPSNNDGWSAGRIATGALAVGGLAAATYMMRRRMRRKTATERLADAAMQAFGTASGFARDRHPAWWASLAAAALPAAYYAWSPSPPPPAKRAEARLETLAHELGGYAGSLSARLPSTYAMAAVLDDLTASAQRGLRRTMSADWTVSVRPDLAMTAGLLAASGLAFYLARRSMKPKAANTRIADIMTRQPRVVQPDATVAEAASMMRRLDIGALPVCDGSRLIGMLTDRDITVRSTADGRDPHLTPVRDIMSPGVAWASEDDPVEAAARIMREHRIRRLPIVDERHSLVGVVSLGDLAVDVGDEELSGETLETISEKD